MLTQPQLRVSLLLLHSHWTWASPPGTSLPVIDCTHDRYQHNPCSSLSSAPMSVTDLILPPEVPVTLYMSSYFIFLTAHCTMILFSCWPVVHLATLSTGPSLPNSHCTLDRAHTEALRVWLLDGGANAAGPKQASCHHPTHYRFISQMRPVIFLQRKSGHVNFSP